jgi:DNA invertase Pin-like site-specific DNA recombinase
MDTVSVWIYLRKSRDRREWQDPSLLEKQKNELLHLVEQDGRQIRPDNILEEIGSGDRIESRLVFRQWLRMVETLPRDAGGVLYVTELSRLTRGSHSQAGRILDALERANILIRTRERYYDLRNASEEALLHFHRYVARMELQLIKQRVTATRSDMVRQGKITTGRAPFGYEWSRDQHTLVKNDREFPRLVEICQRALHESCYRLGREYGIPPCTITTVLRNPVICGWPARRHGPHHDTKPWINPYIRLTKEDWDWPEQQNTAYPHACTKEEWDHLQEVLDRRCKKRAEIGSPDGWCRNLVRFIGADGAPLHNHTARLGSNHSGRHTFLTYEIGGEGSPKLYVDRDAVHQAAEAAVRAAGCEPVRLQRVIKEYRACIGIGQEPDTVADIHILEAQLIKYRDGLDGLLEREIHAEDPEEAASIARVRAAHRREINRLKSELQGARERPDRIPALDTILNVLPLLLANFEEVWAELSAGGRREVATGFLESVPVQVTPHPTRNATRRTVLAPIYALWLRR